MRFFISKIVSITDISSSTAALELSLELDLYLDAGADWPSGRPGEFLVGLLANKLKITSLHTPLCSHAK